MKAMKKYSKVFVILLNVPFAFTNATKQRLRKRARLLLNEA